MKSEMADERSSLGNRSMACVRGILAVQHFKHASLAAERSGSSTSTRQLQHCPSCESYAAKTVLES